MSKIDLLSLTLEDTQRLMEDIGEKKFRGKQVFEWVNKGIKDMEFMSNLSKALREKLKEKTYITTLQIEEKLTSKIDGTVKYLFALEDRNIIEGVVMEYKHGLTACLSSQVGCAMGCSFCASTLEGLIRNLKAGEIIDQILLMQKDLGKRISNIVLMGSGEPLHNYEEVMRFLKIVNDENGLNVGNRHITLSTCGLVPEIKRLADSQIPINLAISLHAPNDTIREKMMPIGQRYRIHEIIDACQYYLKKNNRRITFEYALVNGMNDGEEEAYELSQLIRGLLCHVNLIPVNPIDEKNYKKSKREKTQKFLAVLKSQGIEATIRREMGSDINAACGQLRNRHLKRKKQPINAMKNVTK